MPHPSPAYTHARTLPQAQFIVAYIVFIARGLCLADLSPTSHWLTTAYFYMFMVGLTALSHACLIEGKRLPTFPVCLCRKANNKKRGRGPAGEPGVLASLGSESADAPEGRVGAAIRVRLREGPRFGKR